MHFRFSKIKIYVGRPTQRLLISLDRGWITSTHPKHIQNIIFNFRRHFIEIIAYTHDSSFSLTSVKFDLYVKKHVPLVILH